MASNEFDFDFDEIRIQDTDDFPTTDLDNILVGEESAEDNQEVSKFTGEVDDTVDDILDDPAPVDKKESEEDDVAEIVDNDILGTEDEVSEEEEEDEAGEVEAIQRLVDNYYDLGIFTGERPEKPITTQEELYELFQEEKRNGANQYLNDFLSKFGADYQEAFKKIFVDGVNPKEYFKSVEPLQDLSSLDMEQEENQIRVVRQYYKDILKYPDEAAEKKIRIMRDAGELVGEADIAFDKIQSSIKQEIEEKAKAKQKEEAQKEYAKQVFETSLRTTLQTEFNSNEYQGIPLNEKVTSQAYSNLIAPAWRLPSGEVITDFEKFLLDLKKPEFQKTAILIDILRQNNFDLSVVQAKKDTEKKGKLFDALAVKEKSVRRNNPVNSSPPQKFI